MSCPNCNSPNVHSAMATDKFPYGIGLNPVELQAEVLLFSCSECGESWTGEQGEEAREAAVAAHLASLKEAT